MTHLNFAQKLSHIFITMLPPRLITDLWSTELPGDVINKGLNAELVIPRGSHIEARDQNHIPTKLEKSKTLYMKKFNYADLDTITCISGDK